LLAGQQGAAIQPWLLRSEFISIFPALLLLRKMILSQSRASLSFKYCSNNKNDQKQMQGNKTTRRPSSLIKEF
jgi:hypothetical protein